MQLRVGVGDEWKQYRVFDRDTGEEIQDVTAGNDETGELERYKRNEKGQFLIGREDGPAGEIIHRLVREIIHRNFEFRRKEDS